MRRFSTALAVGGAMALVVGCSASTPASDLSSWPAPPADSRLAAIQTGMSQHQVMEILGPPDRITNAASGATRAAGPKTPEGGRVYYVYRGLGQVVFRSGTVYEELGRGVLGVAWDPSQSEIPSP